MSNRVKRAQPTRASRPSSSTSSSNGTRLATGLVGLGAVVVLAIVIAIFVAGGGDDDEPAAGISFNGTALPAYGDGVDQAIGLKAPIFVTADLATGDQTVVGGGGGPNDTAKIILFAAHWCPTCQREIPEVADYLNATELPDGVEFVAVSTFPDSTAGNYPPEDWFDEVDWPYPVMADDSAGSIAQMYGMSGVPGWVVLDNQNFVLARASGAIGGDGVAQLVALAAG